MRIGDVITCCAPNDALVTGTVTDMEPMKTRSGWHVTIVPKHFGEWKRYVIRPEDEGTAWIYGEHETAKKALEVARALVDRTQVAVPWQGKSKKRRKKDTL
ncbi:MAG TPA: hypothetical protein VGY48_15230 [Vicinamibacterales bacterium]|jgi:hypothetical protein|nr:hypothetical protein [Vicinamibacterales bacterium]